MGSQQAKPFIGHDKLTRPFKSYAQVHSSIVPSKQKWTCVLHLRLDHRRGDGKDSPPVETRTTSMSATSLGIVAAVVTMRFVYWPRRLCASSSSVRLAGGPRGRSVWCGDESAMMSTHDK